MLFAQISDPHVTLPGESPGAGVDSFDNLLRAIAAINGLDPLPQALVVSGDLVERGTPEEYVRLATALAAVRMPWWLMPGNHDDRDALGSTFPSCASARGPWGIQSVVDLPPLRLLLLDSLVPGTPAGELSAASLVWLEEHLAHSPTVPTIVFVHHPPAITGLAQFDGSGLRNGDALAAVIARHPQVVRVASGHIHRALSCGWAGTTLTVCPSTAHQFELDLRERGRITPVADAPAYQLHRWNGGVLFTYTLAVR